MQIKLNDNFSFFQKLSIKKIIQNSNGRLTVRELREKLCNQSSPKRLMYSALPFAVILTLYDFVKSSEGDFDALHTFMLNIFIFITAAIFNWKFIHPKRVERWGNIFPEDRDSELVSIE